MEFSVSCGDSRPRLSRRAAALGRQADPTLIGTIEPDRQKTRSWQSLPLCSSSNFAGQAELRSAGRPRAAVPTKALRWLQNLFLNLLHQAVELGHVQTEGMLSVARFLARDVPVRHPAELLAFGRLQHDDKGVKSDFFLFFSQPRFQLFGEKRRNYPEIPVAGSQLEVEIEMQLPRSAAGWTLFRRLFRELVEGVEEFVVRGIFLMTLSAVKILCRHV